jgi:phosphatidylinositol alpha-1,6-mannosyltransferase
MKILILATDAYGGYGGIAQYNRDLVEAICEADDGIQIELLVRCGEGPIGEYPRQVVQFPPLRSKLVFAAFAIWRSFRSKPDIVINAHLFHGPLALMISKLTGARLLSQLHGTEVWTKLPKRHLVPLEYSDRVFCVSRDTRRRLMDQTTKLHERAVVISNTVGSMFCPGDRAKARQRFNIKDERVILTVARLANQNGYKGHDRIIKMLPALNCTSGSPIIYLIAGVGEDRARLDQLSYTLGVSHLVHFLGKVPPDELPDLYRAADLFALPSTGEGFGIAFIESMACGTPAIGLAVGGAPDALGDGALGHCVPPEMFEGELLKAIGQSNFRDPNLGTNVQARFGRNVFQRHIKASLSRLMKTKA